MKTLALGLSLGLVFGAHAMAQGIYGQQPSPGIYGGGSPTYGSGSNPSSHGVGGYTTQQGTYVAPHMQTNPNTTQMDNYSTRGNVNPYTGATGTRSPR